VVSVMCWGWKVLVESGSVEEMSDATSLEDESDAAESSPKEMNSSAGSRL